MKNLILIFSLTISCAFGQVFGVAHYKLAEDTLMHPGKRIFYYPKHSPYHKIFGYAEQATSEGYTKVINETKRLLSLNGSSIHAPYEIQETLYRESRERIPLIDLFNKIQKGEIKESFVLWEIKDKNKQVSTHWIVELFIMKDWVHVYVYNSYVHELYANQEYVESLK